MGNNKSTLECQLSPEARKAIILAILKAEMGEDALQIPERTMAEIFRWVTFVSKGEGDGQIEESAGRGGVRGALGGEDLEARRVRSVVFHGDIFHKPTPEYSC